MFKFESNDNFVDGILSEDQLYNQIEEPEEVKFIDLTLQPHEKVGCKSGAYLLASYYEMMKFMTEDPHYLSDQDIDKSIYDKIIHDQDGNITLSNGINCIADLLNGSSILKYKPIYALYAINLKRMIQKHSFSIVELKANSAYCSMDSQSMNGKYEISANQNVLAEDLTKAFICVGYDKYGAILFNSLGKSYGQCGYIKMKWDVLNQNFIKAVALTT